MLEGITMIVLEQKIEIGPLAFFLLYCGPI